MIIDTFPFNKDFNALEIRFEELKNSVDLFVASESAYTHSGIKKNLHLSEATDLRKAMGKKLVVLVNNRKFLTNNPRTREMLQRQLITKYLNKSSLAKTDIIMHSDCDEIPRASVVDTFRESGKFIDVLLELDNYANYLNAYDGIWPRGRVQSFGLFKSIQNMRADIFIQKAYSYKRHGLPFMRLTDFWSNKRYPLNILPEYVKYPRMEIIANAGWHFNNLFPENEIIEKIESSCHVEWNTEEVRKNAIINYRNACDIYSGTPHKLVSVDSTYPRYVIENLPRWKDFIKVA